MTVTTTTQPTMAPARHHLHIPLSLRHMLRRLTGRIPDANATCLVPPTGVPGTATPGNAKAPNSHPPGTAVWAYIARAWLPASVTEADGNSALVTYQVPGTGETSLEVVHHSHLAPRCMPKATAKTPPSLDEDTGHARATLLVHHTDNHGMCQGCADLAHFCWAPCPAARDAMRYLDRAAAHLAGTR